VENLNPPIVNDAVVINENRSPKIDPALNPFNPKNGYNRNGPSNNSENLTFISEIITEPGVEVVGPLPRDISTPTALVGFLTAHAKDQKLPKRCFATCLRPTPPKCTGNAICSRGSETAAAEKRIRSADSEKSVGV
jgi:hypothetical protein